MDDRKRRAKKKSFLMASYSNPQEHLLLIQKIQKPPLHQ
jgi:hypothetical protein